ncbi:MAG: hypothetical protein ABSE42_18485 [Bryobacteraceae bacterium]|jgi:hypothetical protein
MRLAFAAFLAPLALAGQSSPSTMAAAKSAIEASAPLLARVAEEADAMAQNITRTLTTETLEQRGIRQPARFRPRAGAAASAPSARSTVRQVVSEYSVGTLKETDSHDLHEFRQVISVDGRPVQTEESARHALSLGMQSPSDRIRKRMLEQFAKHGLVDVATDYGLILLEFTRRGWANLVFGPYAEARIGTDTALVLGWKQISTAGGELEFHGRQAVRQSLQGRLWVRKSDGVPLRVEAWAEVQDGGHRLRDQASVDYVMSAHGFPTPASVVHRHSVDGQLMTENLYRYEPFKMFSAEADIKFTEVPEPPPAPPSQPEKP